MENTTFYMNYMDFTTRARGDPALHGIVNKLTLYIYPEIAVTILLTNVFIVVAVAKFKCLHIPPYLFILNTAIADMLMALMVIPIRIMTKNKMLKPEMCSKTLPLTFFPIWSSILSVLCISIDRFFYIVRPFLYRRYMTMKNASILSAGLWTLSSSISLPVILLPADHNSVDCGEALHNAKYSIFLFLVFGCVIVTMTILYGIICRIAWIQRNRIRNLNVSPQGVDTDNDYKLQKMMITVLGIFYISWIPHLIITAYNATRIDDDHKGRLPLSTISEIIFLCNSFMNPFIYSYQSRKFRAAFKSLLGMKILDEDREGLEVV